MVLENCSQKPLHYKTSKMTSTPSKDSDQPGHPSNLISLSCPHEVILCPKLLSAQQRLRSDCVDAQADLSLCWAHIILLVLLCCGSFKGTA